MVVKSRVPSGRRRPSVVGSAAQAVGGEVDFAGRLFDEDQAIEPSST